LGTNHESSEIVKKKLKEHITRRSSGREKTAPLSLDVGQKEKKMSDLGYFVCLGITILSAITAVLAARSIICGGDGVGSAIALAISSCLGFVSALPFRTTLEMPWLLAAVAALFGSVVLSTILCCLCQIREQTRSKK
jgi:hypothetical protein